MLVANAAPARPDARVLSQIAEIAQGNPFFALELARHAAAGQPLTVTRSVWEAVTARFLDLDESTAAMLRRLADHRR